MIALPRTYLPKHRLSAAMLVATLGLPALAAVPNASAALPADLLSGLPIGQAEANEEISARVTSYLEGTGVVIDRGLRDGLRVGDQVVFTERGGRQQFGIVLELEGRVATVRPEDGQFRPDPGTRATISVPSSRFEKAVPKRPEKPSKSQAPASEPDSPNVDATKPDGPAETPLWTRPDDGFTMDMPLLAEVNAVHPKKRASSLTGRAYASWDRIVDTEVGRGDSFLRFGGGVFGENLFDKGGTLHFDGEFSARRTQRIDDVNEDTSNFRLDRLSYTLGGTRHDWNRLQFGRFLQSDMPEFGVLDGVSWSTRTERGDSYGGSVGFLPEPDRRQESLEDFALSAWYRWVADEREILSFTGGYQKTWHNGTPDRDLFVLKGEYAPAEGWTAYGSAWIDFYRVGDDLESNGPALTYAILDARRRFENGMTLNLDYRHQEFPDLRRSEFPPVSPQQIQDARVDRLGGTLSRWTEGGASKPNARRLYLRTGAWADEEDAGGDAELGVDFYDVLSDDGRLDLAAFGSRGKFSSVVGARLRYGRFGPKRSWSVLYEFRLNDITDFGSDVDNLYQHRARGSYELFRASGFSASLSGELQFQDRANQLFLGLFVQRSF